MSLTEELVLKSPPQLEFPVPNLRLFYIPDHFQYTFNTVSVTFLFCSPIWLLTIFPRWI